MSTILESISLTYQWKLMFSSNATRKKAVSSVLLCDDEKDSIRKHWDGIRVDEFYFRWYKKACIIREEKTQGNYADDIWKYVPDDIYFINICSHFHNLKACREIDDKNLYDLLFYDVRQPATLIRKNKGVLMDNRYEPLSYGNAVSIIHKYGKAVIKKAKLSDGGKGLLFIDNEMSKEELLRQLYSRDGFVVQECISQHPTLNLIHKESVNTIRLTTFYFQGYLHILSSVLRMGVGDCKVDNASSGGIFCGINEDGRLKKYGHDKKMNVYRTHPTSNVMFENIVIPGFDACKKLVRRLSYRFLQASQLISWDLAVDENAQPVLIEVNLRWGDIDFHQISNGPLFGDLTENVINDVFNKNN